MALHPDDPLLKYRQYYEVADKSVDGLVKIRYLLHFHEILLITVQPHFEVYVGHKIKIAMYKR